MGSGIMAHSYLEEYRQRFGCFVPVEERRSSQKDSLPELLARYLDLTATSDFVGEGKSASINSLTTSSCVTNLWKNGSTSEQINSVLNLPADVKLSDATLIPALQPTVEQETDLELLPIGSLSGGHKTSTTVDKLLASDCNLARMQNRRHSSPETPVSDVTKHREPRSRRRTAFNESNQCIDECQSKGNYGGYSKGDESLEPDFCHNTSQPGLALRRTSSTVSAQSTLSADYSSASSVEIKDKQSHDEHFTLLLSEDDSELDWGSDIEDSKLVGSRKLNKFSQLPPDHQQDGESSTSSEDADVCSNCAQETQKPNVLGDACLRCLKHRIERKDVIQEILDSEISYGKDLSVLHFEFYKRLHSNGLLTSSDLAVVFGNLPIILSVNERFVHEVSSHLDEKALQGDVCYTSAMIGHMICDSSAMFLAFENYCLNYGNAIAMIEKLRAERELFNLFLTVSQTDNHLLRRMDLKTFLMIPVQRVMRYPLLLNRLLKLTPNTHPDRSFLLKAIDKLTNILNHINRQARLVFNSTVLGKDAQMKKNNTSEIVLMKLAMDIVGWKHNEIHFVVSGKIGYLQPNDGQWSEKIRSARFNTAYAVLITRGKEKLPETSKRLIFPKEPLTKDGALLILKKGSSKIYLLRDPFRLNTCIVSRNSEFFDVFEIQENIKEIFIMRPVSCSDAWFKHLKYFTMTLGGRNQRRRDALPNVVLHSS